MDGAPGHYRLAVPNPSDPPGSVPRPPRSAMSSPASPESPVDLARYPLHDLAGPAMRAVVRDARASLAAKGVAILPGFLTETARSAISREASELEAKSHLENVWGTPYLGVPDARFPEGHPRRTAVLSLTSVIAYDLIGRNSVLRRLYESEEMLHFIETVLDRKPLYRMADPLGALNLTVMREGHVQGWHYDNADFVVSLAIQASRGGGLFECAPLIRGGTDENADQNYPAVKRVLDGKAGDLVEVFPMVPGTLMVFEGRRSIHRVSPVEGDVPRHVGLLAYDTTPGADSTSVFKLIRYGRNAPIDAS